jgi:hypothetical protein
MSAYLSRRAAGPGVVLLMALVAVLCHSATDPCAGTTSSGAGTDWGEPCPFIHPSACYTGSAEQLSRTALASSHEPMGPANGAPNAVELICFFVEGGDGYVEIEWETASELETLGFYLLRSDDPEGPFQDVSGFVPHCDDGGLVGGLYLFNDGAVQNGFSYYYRLQEVASDQHYVYHPAQDEAPLVAMPAPTPTATQRPSVTSTWTLVPSSTPGPALEPTLPPAPPGTPQPTATPSPTVVARTFTPTPAASAAITPDITSSVRSSLPDPSTSRAPVTPALTAAIPATPDLQANGFVLESPLVTPGNARLPTAYPVESLATPIASPLPTAYVPPPTQRLNQIVTMTPIGPVGRANGRGMPGDATSPRILLYVGFVGSVLLLITGLVVMIRRSQNPPNLLRETGFEHTPSEHDQGP